MIRNNTFISISSAIGEVTKRQRDSIQSKRKVVKMLIAVVVIFGVCW